ncbi:MAG: magnesium transporter [Dethiobacteria bacterium]
MPLYRTALTYLAQKDMEALKKLLNEADIIDVIKLIQDLDNKDRVIVFRLLSKDRALEVFEQLDVDLQQRLLDNFTEEKAVEIVAEMDPDDRARLLDELPARVAKKLLAKLSSEERKYTADLLGYPPETAGRIMTPKYIRLRGELSVGEALEKIRTSGKDKETIYTMYITDSERRLEGVVSLRDLVMASPKQCVEDIMNTEVVKVTTETDQEEVAKVLQDRDLLSVPVVDRENRLVGIITVDDAIDVLEEEITEDIFDKEGLISLAHQESGRSQRLVSGTLWEVWSVRLPFLLITLVGGLLAGAVINVYEKTLESIVGVAFFIPVIMDMGGNVGTQSSTIFSRALALGHINMRRFFRQWLRELGVGLSIGLTLGILAGIVAAIWQPIPGLGFAVGLSLAITVTLATGLGFMIPYLLLKLGLDQAAGSNPIITTIKDITGLIIYFFLVSIFLGR